MDALQGSPSFPHVYTSASSHEQSDPRAPMFQSRIFSARMLHSWFVLIAFAVVAAVVLFSELTTRRDRFNYV